MNYRVLSIKLKRYLHNTAYLIPNTGFTLIEVLITLTIAAVAGGLIVQVVIQNNGLFYQETTKVSHGLTLNTAKHMLQNDLKTASSIASGYPVSAPNFITSSTLLVLQVPSVDSSGNIIENVYDYIVYSKDPNTPKIFRKNYYPDPASSKKSQNQVLLTELSFLEFTYLNQSGVVVSPAAASSVMFTLKVNTQVGLVKQEASTSGNISLRNI